MSRQCKLPLHEENHKSLLLCFAHTSHISGRVLTKVRHRWNFLFYPGKSWLWTRDSHTRDHPSELQQTASLRVWSIPSAPCQPQESFKINKHYISWHYLRSSHQLSTHREDVSFYLYANVHMWWNETGREHLGIKILHKLYTSFKKCTKMFVSISVNKFTEIQNTTTNHPSN